ncbi:hypothetical protein EJ02DRAFT_466045 [Clathrospora elynae]|uniref:Uncharacterized protein n=1 Tax=Clathrospora elynae TaxID=706981 RepID=A0A6A5SYM7_9PLEO|nr:hypothetical protein EJ02DRAFT_466045 [Clathrospora elynae]
MAVRTGLSTLAILSPELREQIWLYALDEIPLALPSEYEIYKRTSICCCSKAIRGEIRLIIMRHIHRKFRVVNIQEPAALSHPLMVPRSIPAATNRQDANTVLNARRRRYKLQILISASSGSNTMPGGRELAPKEKLSTWHRALLQFSVMDIETLILDLYINEGDVFKNSYLTNLPSKVQTLTSAVEGQRSISAASVDYYEN